MFCQEQSRDQQHSPAGQRATPPTTVRGRTRGLAGTHDGDGGGLMPPHSAGRRRIEQRSAQRLHDSRAANSLSESGAAMNDRLCLIQHLRQSKFGRLLRTDQVRRLAAIAEEQSLPAAEILFEEGCQADALWVICSGSVDIRMAVRWQADSTILTVGPGELLGWSALVGDGLMSATAVAAEPTTLVRLPADPLKDLCISDHTLGYAVMGTVAATLNSRLNASRRQLVNLSQKQEGCTPLAVRVGSGGLPQAPFC